METYKLRIELKSDATFGRGDGVPGLVDQEVEQDECGLPYLRGRTLKGLLVEECANIIYALGKQKPALAQEYQQAAERMFGRARSGLDSMATLRIGDAQLPVELRSAVRDEIERGALTPADVLESLTDIRRQTAMDETGKPEEHSLRAVRVILRRTCFVAQLVFQGKVDDTERALLAACAKAFRRAGTSRNRGLGRLTATLLNEQGQDVTDTLFRHFMPKEVPAQ
jgi:hypothetical protein